MRAYRLALFVIGCFATATVAAAQVNRATISGTVTDSSGAALPGVTVTVTDESGLTFTAQTNSAGQYTVPSLPVGTYTAKFEMKGFRTFVRDKLTLQVSQTLQLDAELTVGQLTETVSVSGTPQLIQRETSEVGTTVTRDYLTALPLSMGGGRYPETFAYRLSAGVQGDTWTSRINGSPAFSKEVLLEGASVTTYLAGHFGESSVSMEALQEFKVQTSGLSAEYGRTGGGVFNFVMRSGQNQVHGTGLTTLRNEALNANTFLNNAAERPKARDRQSNYGGSFGGPVVIPGAYNGRNRTFFFVAAEKFRVRSVRLWRAQPVGASVGDVRRQLEPAAHHHRRRDGRTGSSHVQRRDLRSAHAQRDQRRVRRGSLPWQHHPGGPHQPGVPTDQRDREAALCAAQRCVDGEQPVSNPEPA